MAQATNASIASGQTGTQYRTQDNDRYAATLTNHSGTSRPSYALAGTLWLDTTATPWVLKLYDGTDDITIGTVNVTTNLFAAANAASTNSTIAMTAAINEAAATVASAATTDIGGAAGNSISVTGTTTITALGTVQAGTRRTVRFAASLTLTHNATSLILPGAANITTSAGDVAEFISLGSGNWFCTEYTKASPTQTLTDAATIAWDVSLGSGTVTLGGNRTLGAPTNGVTGAYYGLRVVQDGTGSRTLAYNAVFKGVTGVTLTTTASAVDHLVFRYNGTNYELVGVKLNVGA
jgi:hypothetical protein